jgi:hypothetical protein
MNLQKMTCVVTKKQINLFLPVVSESPVGTDLLQPLQILTQLVVQDIGHHLHTEKNQYFLA